MKVYFILNASAMDTTPEPGESFISVKASYVKFEDLQYEPQIGWKKRVSKQLTGMVKSVTMSADGTSLDVLIDANKMLTVRDCEDLALAGWVKEKKQ